jgi:hypothetical protein
LRSKLCRSVDQRPRTRRWVFVSPALDVALEPGLIINIGVEDGQLIFVAAVLSSIWLLRYAALRCSS